MINLPESLLKSLYGTLENLEENCDKSKECWKDKLTLKYGDYQKPYKPYLGEQYNGLMFAGINLNGGNNSIDAIDKLVSKAKNDYLNLGKYLIFRDQDYRGSPFYYYVPLLSYLYHSYSTNNVKFAKESDLTKDLIISGFKYCGLTNLIKCSTNSTDGRSKPSEKMYYNCIPKFKKEIKSIKPNALVLFTFFNYPSLLTNHFDGFNVISQKERYRIQRNDQLYVIELEHPLSTQVTRERKFQLYSNAIYELVDLQKMI